MYTKLKMLSVLLVQDNTLHSVWNVQHLAGRLLFGLDILQYLLHLPPTIFSLKKLHYPPMQSIASYNDFCLDAYLCAIRGYLRSNVYIRMKIFFGNI